MRHEASYLKGILLAARRFVGQLALASIGLPLRSVPAIPQSKFLG